MNTDNEKKIDKIIREAANEYMSEAGDVMGTGDVSLEGLGL
jgi:hypothetical protein